jgi:hypothetical protein
VLRLDQTTPAMTPIPTPTMPATAMPVHLAAGPELLLLLTLVLAVASGRSVLVTGQSTVHGRAEVNGVGARLPVVVAPVGAKAGSWVPRLTLGASWELGLRTWALSVHTCPTLPTLPGKPRGKDEAYRCQ